MSLNFCDLYTYVKNPLQSRAVIFAQTFLLIFRQFSPLFFVICPIKTPFVKKASKRQKFSLREIFHGFNQRNLCISTINELLKFWSGSPDGQTSMLLWASLYNIAPDGEVHTSNFDLSNSLSAFFVSLPPWGRGTTMVVDEVLEIYTAQTVGTSSVTRKGSCHLPHGGRLF